MLALPISLWWEWYRKVSDRLLLCPDYALISLLIIIKPMRILSFFLVRRLAPAVVAMRLPVPYFYRAVKALLSVMPWSGIFSVVFRPLPILAPIVAGSIVASGPLQSVIQSYFPVGTVLSVPQARGLQLAIRFIAVVAAIQKLVMISVSLAILWPLRGLVVNSALGSWAAAKAVAQWLSPIGDVLNSYWTTVLEGLNWAIHLFVPVVTSPWTIGSTALFLGSWFFRAEVGAFVNACLASWTSLLGWSWIPTGWIDSGLNLLNWILVDWGARIVAILSSFFGG